MNLIENQGQKMANGSQYGGYKPHHVNKMDVPLTLALFLFNGRG